MSERFSQAYEWLRKHPIVMWLALLLPGGFIYGVADAILRNVWNLSWGYVLPIALCPSLLVIVLFYVWVASRPHPPELPRVKLVLEAGTPCLIPTNLPAPIMSCRFSVTNNSDREVRILHARLQEAEVFGITGMFDGAVRRGDPATYFKSPPQISEIVKGHTEMVFCTFSGLEVNEFTKRDHYEDVVELYDHDGNCYTDTVLFLPAATAPVDLPAPPNDDKEPAEAPTP
ncbi:MAG: hypothetical protein WA860_01690 [Acidimicrobiales bacterium]